MMQVTLKSILFLIVLTLSGFSAYAQEKLSLTVDQAIEIGLQNSKMLHSSLMKTKSAEAKLKEVNASRLPSIKLSASYRRLSEVDPFQITTPFGTFVVSPTILDNYSTQLSLFQPLFTGFRLANSAEIAEHSSNATNEEFNKDKSELVYSIRNAYWSLFKAIQFKKVTDENVEMVKAHLKDANNLMNAGMLTQNDVLKLELQLSDMMFKQVDAENAVKLAAVALNSILSISLNTKIEIASVPGIVTKEYEDLSTLVTGAIEKRHEIKSADYRMKASEAGVSVAKSSWYPQVNLFADYYYSKPNQRIIPAKNEFRDTWDFGVNLSWNIWDWLTTSHQTEQAEALLAQTEDAMQIIKDNITLEVTQNYLSVSQSKRKIEISRLAVEQAEENIRMTSEKFKNGLSLSSEAIDAETALLTTKINYTNSIVDYELAKARLDKSIAK